MEHNYSSWCLSNTYVNAPGQAREYIHRSNKFARMSFRACVTSFVPDFTVTFLHDLTSGPEFVIDWLNRFGELYENNTELKT